MEALFDCDDSVALRLDIDVISWRQTSCSRLWIGMREYVALAGARENVRKSRRWRDGSATNYGGFELRYHACIQVSTEHFEEPP